MICDRQSDFVAPHAEETLIIWKGAVYFAGKED